MRRLLFALFVGSLAMSGCAAFAPSQTVSQNNPNVRSIVIQYSGGKEIGRWYLNKFPALGGGDRAPWVFFKNGDTTYDLSGDIRVIYLP